MKSEPNLRLAVTQRAYRDHAAVIDLCDTFSVLRIDSRFSAEQNALASIDVLLDYLPPTEVAEDEAGLVLYFLKQPQWKPVRWSFTQTDWLRRWSQASRQQEALLKVAGKNLAQTHIVDATGGRGYDALLLAKAGASVTVCERDPLVYALLVDAQQRAAQHPLLAPVLQRMQWLCVDAVQYLQQLANTNQAPDMVYCDPMFPARSKRALNQKNLLALQQWLGHGDLEQLNRLMQQALVSARQRVILKYAAQQPLPAGLKASFGHAGKGHHWYVFLTANKTISSGD